MPDFGDTMKKTSEYVNVFQGSGTIDLPKPEGIASRWLFIKALCGNTTPAAASPFGKMTLCAYTGGYPTGYGDRKWNFCGTPITVPEHVRGFSHLHVSGTGGIGTYYNYALTSPMRGALGKMCEEFTEENASVGYYACTLSSGLKFEGTVSDSVAYHRYKSDEQIILQIDFSHGGLLPEFGDRYYDLPEYCRVEALSDTKVKAHTKIQGVDLYFAVECPSSNGVLLWEDYSERKGALLNMSDKEKPIGAAFRCGNNAELRVAISFVSCDFAEKMLNEAPKDFDKAHRATAEKWENYLSKIKIETESDEIREIFYSNLYHSLVKPCSAHGESYLYDKEKCPDFFYDLATMWDMYKTALPLVFTLFPEEAKGITNTLLAVTEADGRSPINMTLSRTTDFSLQARMLAEHTFADYYYRFKDADADRMVDATLTDLAAQKDFLEGGYCERYTHILDICEALSDIADIAEEIDRVSDAKKMREHARKYVNAYDVSTGLMSENSPYYEGDNWNYSFRLHNNMKARTELMGKERFIESLDHLFGYTREPVAMPTEPNVNPMVKGLHSFEGFNNESDMEIPYAYIYAGRHDRTCEIISAGMKYMFTKGKGGLPGNNDSGGLSSMYVWNALGIFPVAGQDKMLIGSPILDGAELALANGKSFKITVYDNNSSHIYVKRAVLNSKELSDFSFSVREMMQGGHLEIYMSDKPV